MGKLKQLHIDCSQGECLAGSPETCYQQYEQASLEDSPYNLLSMEGDTASLHRKVNEATA